MANPPELQRQIEIRTKYVRPLKVSLIFCIGGEFFLLIVFGLLLYPEGNIFYKILWTFSIIETAEDFTVSIPSSDMKKEIMFCGTKSGRDYNKFKECNLQTSDSQKVVTPIIKVPGLHYECKIVYKSAMDPGYLNRDYDTALYPEKDYHTLYFGEILDCYEID